MLEHQVMVARSRRDRPGATINLRTVTYRQQADGSFRRADGRRVNKATRKALKRARQRERHQHGAVD